MERRVIEIRECIVKEVFRDIFEMNKIEESCVFNHMKHKIRMGITFL